MVFIFWGETPWRKCHKYLGISRWVSFNVFLEIQFFVLLYHSMQMFTGPYKNAMGQDLFLSAGHDRWKYTTPPKKIIQTIISAKHFRFLFRENLAAKMGVRNQSFKRKHFWKRYWALYRYWLKNVNYWDLLLITANY